MIKERLRNLLVYAITVTITMASGPFSKPSFKSVSKIIRIDDESSRPRPFNKAHLLDVTSDIETAR